jgi:hypothetical protein
MVLQLKPARGGFLRPFGCGWFIRKYLLGHAPYDSPDIKPEVGAPQADIFFQYKQALRRATTLDRATRLEEKRSKKEHRSISPDNIEKLAELYLARIPYKTKGCRYHSFVNYFSRLQKLGWVEPSGKVEASEFQDNYPAGKPRIYYRLTKAGKQASKEDWADPRRTLYG